MRISAGDEKAFRVLFDHYFDLLFSTALRYTAIRQLAEDAAQQVLMKIWEKRVELPDIDNLQAYLFTAAKREILGHFRKQSVRKEHILQVADLFREAREMDDPETLLISRQQEELLKRVISNLPTRQQEAFRLSRDHQMSYTEIAEAMGISRDTVKEYIGEVLKAVRGYIQANPHLLSCMIGYVLAQKYLHSYPPFL